MNKKILFAALMFVALFLGFGCDNDEPEPIEEIKYYDVEIENAKVIVNSTDTFHSWFGDTFKDKLKSGTKITVMPVSLQNHEELQFKGWSDTEEMNTTRTITVNSDTSIIVNLFLFYRMRVDIDNPQYGTVIPDCGEYQIGDTVRLEAIPNDSGVFMRWSDAHGIAVFSSTLVYPVNPKVFTAIRPENKTEYVRYDYSTYTYIVSVSFKQGENGYCCVDLGLPSGLKWGVAPLGHSLFKWERYGVYYYDDDRRYSYCYNSDEYFDATCGDYEDTDCFTKYNDEDGKTVLDLEDDWAYVKRGGKWRTPTVEEWEELIENCIIEYEEYIDNKDYKDYRVSLVSKINGKKISFYNDRDLHTSAGSIPEKVSFYTSSFASENKSIIYVVGFNWPLYYSYRELKLETMAGSRGGETFILPVLDK